LLVPDQDIPDRRPGHSVGEVNVLLTGDTEHARDTLALKTAYEQVGDPLVCRHPRRVPPHTP
jgi:hypothetical protein